MSRLCLVHVIMNIKSTNVDCKSSIEISNPMWNYMLPTENLAISLRSRSCSYVNRCTIPVSVKLQNSCQGLCKPVKTAQARKLQAQLPNQLGLKFDKLGTQTHSTVPHAQYKASCIIQSPWITIVSEAWEFKLLWVCFRLITSPSVRGTSLWQKDWWIWVWIWMAVQFDHVILLNSEKLFAHYALTS